MHDSASFDPKNIHLDLLDGGAATVMPVTQSMGLPIEPLGLLLAVDTIPDVFATTGNVTGDLTATSIVARQSPDARDADEVGG